MRADETVEERERHPGKGRRGNLTITVIQQDAALPTLELFSPPILYSLLYFIQFQSANHTPVVAASPPTFITIKLKPDKSEAGSNSARSH